MRIIGGLYSKRLIRPPKGLAVRPTTDMAKESLFNILSNKLDFHGLDALDLFSGTGSIAYEFVSRGCSQVLAVDSNFKCIRFIEKTADEFGMNQLKAIKSDVFRYIKTSNKKFDIIFADAPYQMENIPEISTNVFEKGMLKQKGWLIVEHPKEIDLSEKTYFVEHRKYGHVNFSFFQYSD